MGVIVWLPGLFARNNDLTSYKSDLHIAYWLPGLVAVDCRSEFYFYRDPISYSVSSRISKKIILNEGRDAF